MDKFHEGGVVFHKATSMRCVIITVNKTDNKITVRTEKDEEKEYYPQELKTQDEAEADFKQSVKIVNRNNYDGWSI